MKYSKTIAGITIEICEKAIGEDLVLTLSGGVLVPDLRWTQSAVYSLVVLQLPVVMDL